MGTLEPFVWEHEQSLSLIMVTSFSNLSSDNCIEVSWCPTDIRIQGCLANNIMIEVFWVVSAQGQYCYVFLGRIRMHKFLSAFIVGRSSPWMMFCYLYRPGRNLVSICCCYDFCLLQDGTFLLFLFFILCYIFFFCHPVSMVKKTFLPGQVHISALSFNMHSHIHSTHIHTAPKAQEQSWQMGAWVTFGRSIWSVLIQNYSNQVSRVFHQVGVVLYLCWFLIFQSPPLCRKE